MFQGQKIWLLGQNVSKFWCFKVKMVKNLVLRSKRVQILVFQGQNVGNKVKIVLILKYF